MSTHTKQLYPATTPQGSQDTQSDTILFKDAAYRLGEVLKTVPEDQRDGVRLTGWLGLRMVMDYTDTPAEVAAARDKIVAEMLEHESITKEQIAEFKARWDAAA